MADGTRTTEGESRGRRGSEFLVWLIALILLVALYVLVVNPLRDVQRTVHRIEEKVDRLTNESAR